MKLKVNLGELDHVCIDKFKKLPVVDFNHKVIGEADIFKNDHDVTADIKVLNHDFMEKIKGCLEFGVAGKITSREGNKITGFDLTSVSLQFKEPEENGKV